MDRPLIPRKEKPEAKVRDAVRDYLTIRNWYVKLTHGNAFTEGWPDLFCCHSTYGQRWVEIKLPDMKGSKFTPAQLRDFPKFIAFGSGIWVITAATESEYQKLFAPPNFWQYLDVWKHV